MHLTILTPLAALVALAALLPLAAWALAERRVGAAREVLGLAAPARARWWAPAALVLALLLVGAAAAQPVLSGGTPRAGGRNGQVLVVVDTSESMRAGTPPRIDRAVAAAEQIRGRLTDARVGLASMTDRVLPHLFPTLDRSDFRVTLAEAIGVDRPPPGHVARRASGFDGLAAIGDNRFFFGEGPRVVVVLTDGESRAFRASAVASALARAGVRVVLVRLWRSGERIRGDTVYRSDPSSLPAFQELANALGTRVYGERQLAGAVAELRRDLAGSAGAAAARTVAGATPLAPFALLAAFVPLGALLLRRIF